MSLNVILAQTPAASSAQPQQPGWTMVVPVAIMFIALYFVLIRPQSRKAKEHAQLLKTIKPGDKVVTSGGVIGTAVNVKERTVSLRSADTKLEVLKSAVSEITDRTGESAP